MTTTPGILLALLLLTMTPTLHAQGGAASLHPDLRAWLDARAAEHTLIPAERRAALDSVALQIANLGPGEVRLLYVCTHNSRRSHMAQLTAQAAAHYHGVPATTYSAGTEATAFHRNAIEALRRAGFRIAQRGPTPSPNPIQVVNLGADLPQVEAFSKKIDDPANPKRLFVAVMVCDHASETCPVVAGASLRVALTYTDPKISDGTPEEAATYDARCQQIGREQLYLMQQIARLRKS
jgi:protein-tyrosine-phosphatase